MSCRGNIPPKPGTSNNLKIHGEGEVGLSDMHLTLRPCQSQIKITALLQQTKSIRRIRHSLLKPTVAVQFVVSSHHLKIYSKNSKFPKLGDRSVWRLTLLERQSESLLRLESDLSSPILSNVNQSANQLCFIGCNDCLITLPSCWASQWGSSWQERRQEEQNNDTYSTVKDKSIIT